MINLEHYLNKIKINLKPLSSLSPSEQKQFLADIYFAHLKTFPYENFELRTIAKQHPVQRKPLNFFSYDRLLTENRGGYCYQTATLLYDALTQLGFSVKPCIARILGGAPINDPKLLQLPATHMLLVISIAGYDYLIDPGLGVSPPRRPILITDANADQVIIQHPNQFKFYKVDNLYILERKVNDSWIRLLQTDLQEVSQHQLKRNLLNLERYPSTLSIRDTRTLVGLVTDDGYKTLTWDEASQELKFSQQKDDLFIKETLSSFESGQKKLVEEFNINYISARDLQDYCTKTSLPKPIQRWEINFPIDKTELADLEKNLSFKL